MLPLVTSVTGQQTGRDLGKHCSRHAVDGGLSHSRDQRQRGVILLSRGPGGVKVARRLQLHRICVQIVASRAMSDEREAYRHGRRNPTMAHP